MYNTQQTDNLPKLEIDQDTAVLMGCLLAILMLLHLGS